MASDIKIVYHNNVFAGSGAPADGDLLTRDNSSHPKDSVYIDRDSGTVYIRKATTLVADTDWQAPSSGGSGGGGTVLQSPDNTLWLIGVNDSGALQTTQVASGTSGTLSLFSPDNTEWNVTVNNSGALTTTAI